MNIAAVATRLSTVGGPRVQLGVAKVAKYSPQILTGIGIIGGVASTVMIARATLKLEPLVDEHKLGKEIIQENIDAGTYGNDRERQKDVTKLYVNTGLNLVKVKVFNPNGLSDYIRWFDTTNKNWETANKELNYLFLKNMQNWANDRLNARGFLYLNEVYSWLGFPEIPAGQVVGWLHKDFANGDGYVDFGWDNPANAQVKKAFLEGHTDGILLDFNVDGEINSKL